jgi:hypothetical protein
MRRSTIVMAPINASPITLPEATGGIRSIRLNSTRIRTIKRQPERRSAHGRERCICIEFVECRLRQHYVPLAHPKTLEDPPCTLAHYCGIVGVRLLVMQASLTADAVDKGRTVPMNRFISTPLMRGILLTQLDMQSCSELKKIAGNPPQRKSGRKPPRAHSRNARPIQSTMPP